MKKTWILLVLAALLVFALAMPATAADASTPHCYCGGTSATGHKVDGCTGNLNQTWTAWTGTNALPTDGSTTQYYYLTADITGCKQNNVGGTIYLDLNGKKVQMNAGTFGYFLGDAGDNLTITDFVGGGTIKAAGTSTHEGGLIKNQVTTSTVSIYGGTLDGNGHTANGSGGVIYNAGTLNIFDGVVKGGNAKQGGAIVSISSGTLNIKGGTIYGGAASGIGGAIYCRNIVNITGGTIVGGTAGGNGGGAVCYEVSNAANHFTMTGGEIKDGNHTNTTAYGGGNLAIHGGTANIGGTAKITNGKTSNQGGNIGLFGGATLNITGGTIEGGHSNSHGGNIWVHNGTVNHSAGTVKNGTSSQFGGNVWLQNAVQPVYNLSGTGEITGGHSTKGGGNVGLFSTGGTFNMTGGSVTNGISDNGWGANFHINGAGPAIKISGGTVSGGKAGFGSMYLKGGSIEISGTANIDSSEMTGVTSGAALCVDSAVTVNIKGGTIKGGTVSGNGGAIFASNGTWTISGGQIIGGTAGNCGGAMRLAGPANVTMSAGTITGGTAKYGAAIAVEGGSFTMSNGTVNGGKATGSCGGTISLDGGSVTISGGTVNGGTLAQNAAYGGGTFAIYGTGTMNVSGGTINAGTAPRGNCGYMNKGTLNITGGTVAGVSKFGGTINVSGAPTASIALGTNQFFSIPTALTEGAAITYSMDDWSGKVAQGASKVVATASLPYITTYNSSLYVESDGAIRLAAVARYDSTSGSVVKDGVWGLATLAEAKTGAGTTLKLAGNITVDNLNNVADKTVIDLNGFTLTLNSASDLTGIILADSTADGYTAGTGKIAASNVSAAPARAGVDTKTNYRYVTILDGGNYTAHRIYVGIKSAVLAPYGPSVNFRTVLKCDDVVAAKIGQYGAQFTGTSTATSASNKEIVSGKDNTNEWITTLANATPDLFESEFTSYAFFTLTDDLGTATIQSSTMPRSIKAMVEYGDTNFATLTATQQTALVHMYKTYSSAMANGWSINNIVAKANGGNSTT